MTWPFLWGRYSSNAIDHWTPKTFTEVIGPRDFVGFPMLYTVVPPKWMQTLSDLSEGCGKNIFARPMATLHVAESVLICSHKFSASSSAGLPRDWGFDTPLSLSGIYLVFRKGQDGEWNGIVVNTKALETFRSLRVGLISAISQGGNIDLVLLSGPGDGAVSDASTKLSH